jgi:hypothetical protein
MTNLVHEHEVEVRALATSIRKYFIIVQMYSAVFRVIRMRDDRTRLAIKTLSTSSMRTSLETENKLKQDFLYSRIFYIAGFSQNLL